MRSPSSIPDPTPILRFPLLERGRGGHPVGRRRGGRGGAREFPPEGVGADLRLKAVDEARVDAYPLERLRDLARRGGERVGGEEGLDLAGLLLRGEGAAGVDDDGVHQGRGGRGELLPELREALLVEAPRQLQALVAVAGW